MSPRTRISQPARWRKFAARWSVATASVLALAVSTAPLASAQPPEEPIRGMSSQDRVKGSYIVVLNGNPSVVPLAQSLVAQYGGDLTRTYSTALDGFAVETDKTSARRLAADPAVDYVEANRRAHAVGGTQQDPPSWGLDRVDQAHLPLDSSYSYPGNAANVTAYIIDTGIRVTHNDFGSRASWGVNTTGDGRNYDCNGHGTHVAGTTGGTTYGVAKKVELVAVKVLGCDGWGTIAGIIDGVDWVTRNADEPAVANMSIGADVSPSMDAAITNSIESGIVYAVAAGNADMNACYNSPARVPKAITAGATTVDDQRSYYSNWGDCLDVFAPGSGITSAWNGSDTDSNTISGTSMASPHVAGVAALINGAHPSWTPRQVRDKLVSIATGGVVSDPNGSPNRLLRVPHNRIANDFSVSVSPTSVSTEPGGTVTATVSTKTTKGEPQSLTLSTTGVPDGASVTFDPASITSGQQSTLTVSTSGSVRSGNYSITIVGTGEKTTNRTTLTLTVTGCANFESTYSGQLATDEVAVEPNDDWFYTDTSGQHSACLDGPDGTDFDLWLQKWDGYEWVYVDHSATSGPDEQLTYDGTAGYYRYVVHAYSGSGKYTLGYNTP